MSKCWGKRQSGALASDKWPPANHGVHRNDDPSIDHKGCSSQSFKFNKQKKWKSKIKSNLDTVVKWPTYNYDISRLEEKNFRLRLFMATVLSPPALCESYGKQQTSWHCLCYRWLGMFVVSSKILSRIIESQRYSEVLPWTLIPDPLPRNTILIIKHIKFWKRVLDDNVVASKGT